MAVIPEGTGPSRGEQQKQDTRRRLVEAAIQVFARQGYFRATVDEVASAAGTSKGGVYVHFDSKEALLLTLMDEMAARLWEAVRPLLEGASHSREESRAPERIAAILLRVLAVLGENPSLTRIVLLEAPVATEKAQERQLALRQAFLELIGHNVQLLVDQGKIAPVPAALVARFLFGAVHELVISWLHGEIDGPLTEAGGYLIQYHLKALGLALPEKPWLEDVP